MIIHLHNTVELKMKQCMFFFLVSHTAGKNSNIRPLQSMVHNPIYNGPEYESIHPHYETLQLVPQPEQHNITIMSSSTPESGNSTSCTTNTQNSCHPH